MGVYAPYDRARGGDFGEVGYMSVGEEQMNLQVAICDDEKIITDDIKLKIISYRPEFEIDIFNSGLDLLNSKKDYDIIFLDIEMPEMNGMEAAAKLRERKYEGYIIFLTSHTERMPEAFKVRAFRFLNKPVDDILLKEAIDDAEKDIFDNKKIAVSTANGTFFINQTDIVYLETVHNITNVHTKNECFETRKTLHEWMKILGTENFCQVHRSYIVALRYVVKIETNSIILKYSDLEIPISRRKTGYVKNEFYKYVKKNALYV